MTAPPGDAVPPREPGEFYGDPNPSDAAYPPWVMQELIQASIRMQPQLRVVSDSFVGRKADARMLVAVQAEVDRIVERELPREVKRYAAVDFDPFSREAKVSIAVPLYRHDCDACTYLGRFTDDPTARRRTWFDLYTCSVHTVHLRTFVARFGDDGPAFHSGPEPMVERFEPLREAVRRWERMVLRG